MGLRVKAGDIAVSPAGKGFKTLGEVAMVNGAVVVTAKEGTLRVEGAGRTTEVAKGKTIAIMQKAAGAPQGAGSASHHWTQAQYVNIITLAASGVGLGFSIADYQKAKDALASANTAAANAAQADKDAQAATTAANQADADAKAATSAALAAEAAAKAACRVVSPNDPACQ